MKMFLSVIKYFRTRKKLWLIPILLILFILGALFAVSHGTPFAPLIYTIF